MFGWKNLSIFFITPVQSSHHSGSSSCWSQRGSVEGNHYHLFWECPKIITLWQKIHAELESVFKTKMTFNWDELLFGLLCSSTNYQTKHCSVFSPQKGQPGVQRIFTQYCSSTFFFFGKQVKNQVAAHQVEVSTKKTDLVLPFHWVNTGHLTHSILLS